MLFRISFVIVGILALIAIGWFGLGLYTWYQRTQSDYRLEFLSDGRIISHENTGTTSQSISGQGSDDGSTRKSETDAGVAGDVIAKDLVAPVGLVPLSGARVITVERNGQISIVFPDQSVSKIGIIPGVLSGGELGVVSIAPASNIVADQPEFYALFSYRESAGEIFNKVSKIAVIGATGSSVTSGRVTEDILIDRIPTSSNNNSGVVALGSDGIIWVVTGDAGRAVQVQDQQSVAGKVLRFWPNRQVPTDNPIAGSPVYASGFRRPLGITWNDRGEGFVIDAGNNGYDEINKLVVGGNYGWPIVGSCWSEVGATFIDPLICSGKNSWSPSGLDWLTFSASSSSDILIMSGLASKTLYEVSLPRATSTNFKVRSVLKGTYGRLRAVMTLGGDVWFVTSNRDSAGSSQIGDDKIIRLSLPQ